MPLIRLLFNSDTLLRWKFSIHICAASWQFSVVRCRCNAANFLPKSSQQTTHSSLWGRDMGYFLRVLNLLMFWHCHRNAVCNFVIKGLHYSGTRLYIVFDCWLSSTWEVRISQTWIQLWSDGSNRYVLTNKNHSPLCRTHRSTFSGVHEEIDRKTYIKVLRSLMVWF